MFPQNREFLSRNARLGGAVAAAAVFVAALSPATASAQEGSAGSDSGSVDSAVGMIPEEIVVGPQIGGGSEGLRGMGSDAIPDTVQSVGEVVGSVAPVQALGSAGGSAAASVASSGSLPGSTYVNPTGSVGSGTIGLGSVRIPEMALPAFALELGVGAAAVMGERQAAGELTPDELNFWHGVVSGSAQGGDAIEEAAEATGTELPATLTGSIESVREAAATDPFEEQERRRAELEAEAEAEAEVAETAAAAVGAGGA